MSRGAKKLIVMIPAFNEEKTIGDVIREIPRKISGISNVRVLVIDDCSRDRTLEVAKRAGAEYFLTHKNNQGLGVTFRDGIDRALELGADIIVNIDADGQFDPHDIETLIKPILSNGADMVSATRFLKPEMTNGIPWIKKWGNKQFTRLVSRVTGKKFTDTQCGFRVYSREAALRLNLLGKFTYTQEVFIDMINKGMKIKEVPVVVKYYKDRNSRVSGSLLRYGLKSLGIIVRTTRDTQPLSFFGLPGAITFGLGFIGGTLSFIYWLFYHVTTPIRTLFNVSIFLMIFGLSLSILALLADMFKTIKMNQDQILYMLRKREFGNGR